MTPKKQKSGGARDTENGLGTIILKPTVEEKEAIRQAAELQHRSVRSYALHAAVVAAKKDLEKREK